MRSALVALNLLSMDLLSAFMAFNELETLCMLPHPGSILRVKATDIFATHASTVLQVKTPWD